MVVRIEKCSTNAAPFPNVLWFIWLSCAATRATICLQGFRARLSKTTHTHQDKEHEEKAVFLQPFSTSLLRSILRQQEAPKSPHLLPSHMLAAHRASWCCWLKKSFHLLHSTICSPCSLFFSPVLSACLRIDKGIAHEISGPVFQ